MSIKCGRCDQKALFHITEIEDDGEIAQHHLCWMHAQEYMRSTDDKPPGEPSAVEQFSVLPESTATCPICKMNFNDFRKTGRLGCGHDYKEFREELSPLIENIHGNLKHVGKSPRRAPTNLEHQILRLRHDLQEAVAKEDYERAAKLRDRIDEMESQSRADVDGAAGV